MANLSEVQLADALARWEQRVQATAEERATRPDMVAAWGQRLEDRLLREARLPKRHRRVATWAHVLQQEADAALDVVDWLRAESEQRPFLSLLGSVGVGKTSLATVLGLLFVRHRIPVLFLHAQDLTEAILDSRDWRAPADVRDGASDLLRSAKRRPVLILDDLGAEEPPTKAVAAEVVALIDHRWRNELATVTTTNAGSRNELTSRYGPRMVDRLLGRETAVIVSFTRTISYRQEPVTDEPATAGGR